LPSASSRRTCLGCPAIYSRPSTDKPSSCSRSATLTGSTQSSFRSGVGEGGSSMAATNPTSTFPPAAEDNVLGVFGHIDRSHSLRWALPRSQCAFPRRGLNRSAMGKTAISFTSRRPQQLAPCRPIGSEFAPRLCRRAVLRPDDDTLRLAASS
jgi:hypothetical protein